MLFNSVDDRQETTLAYEANYFPHWHIKSQHKIVFSECIWKTKAQILALCEEKLEYLDRLPQDRRFTEQPFKIHWAYGNIPTKEEWEKIHPMSCILLEYRISPLIKVGEGRIVLLTPHTQQYYEGKKK